MTAAYTLYTGKRSGAASIEVLLGALGLEVERREAAPWTEPVGAFYEELRAVNPLAQLPTLVTPGGEILTESVAIQWTLLERHKSDWVPAPSTRDRPFVCDVYLANLSKWWTMRDYLRARHPVFCDAMERVDGLPEVAPVWQRHWS